MTDYCHDNLQNHCYIVMRVEVHVSCHGCIKRDKKLEMNVKIMEGRDRSRKKQQRRHICLISTDGVVITVLASV
jgi:DNA-directed RNA polymerase alpha subunit